MKKRVLTVLIGASLSTSVIGMENLSISGFGSVGIGQSNNDVGYAGYTSDHMDTKPDTVAGIQFEFQVNDKAEFTAQLVANGRYDFEPSVEFAYLSYEFDQVTARAGKMRTPLFMYSDYLDVGYALPTIRPSQEMYEQLIINSYTGGDLLIPFDIGDTHLELQPFAGVSQIEERDSAFGEVDLKDAYGITAHWYINDLTLRASYVSSTPSIPNDSVAKAFLEGKDGEFISLGAQYDNGNLLAVMEGMTMTLAGQYPDVAAVSGLLGYRFGEFTPYLSMNWNKTTDDEERDRRLIPDKARAAFNFKQVAYSLGTRWDLEQNMALKFDVTYVDFLDTTGGYLANISSSNDPVESGSLVYSVALDFVF